MIKVGSDFSGVGAFEQALAKINLNHEVVFACDMDKYARQTYLANYGEPKYYPKNVYDREIPIKSLDLYMTSPPCQAFSVAGKRLGEKDERGVLFYNSYEFIKQNRPRFFIFENVKGLLSHNKKATFNNWLEHLAKSVNGEDLLFMNPSSVGYHVYWKVLNSKNYGVPQNRERVFIVGIRDDVDNEFEFPQEEELTKRLVDILDENVDKKYFVSDKTLQGIINSKFNQRRNIIQDTEGPCATLLARDYKDPKCVAVNSATKKGYEVAKEGDSINLSFPNSKTRRGRVGKGVAQTIDTNANQGVLLPDRLFGFFDKEGRKHQAGSVYDKNKISPCIDTAQGGWRQPCIAASRGRYVDGKAKQHLETRKDGVSNSLTTVQKDNLLIHDYNVRRLTPRECFRLQDFPDSFIMPCSDTQMYKQAGNSITVAVLAKIIKNLRL